MKKISKTPEIPKPSINSRPSRQRLNESMRHLLTRDGVNTSSKQTTKKFLNRKGTINTDSVNKQNKLSKKSRIDNNLHKDHLGFMKTCNIRKNRLSYSTKHNETPSPTYTTISPYNEIISPRATHSTIRKGQMPDSIVKQLADYDGGYKPVNDTMVTINCIIHNDKKSKFMIKGNHRIPGLCSKCAVKLAKDGYCIDEISIESSEKTKKTQLDNFLVDLNKIIDKYDNLEKRRSVKIAENIKLAKLRINKIELLFQEFINVLETKKRVWIDSIKADIDSIVQDVDNFGIWLRDNKSELNLMKNDIKSNFNDIIERVDKIKFIEILGHFNDKLHEINVCAIETSIREPSPFIPIDNKSIITQFDALIERFLLNNGQNTFPNRSSKIKQQNTTPDYFISSQSFSLQQQANDLGSSINIDKIGIDSIYKNYIMDKGFDSSIRVVSETLLSQETIKGIMSPGINGSK